MADKELIRPPFESDFPNVTTAGFRYYQQIAQYINSLNAGNGDFIQSGTGAVTRTAQDKMRERVSVLDFGGVGDGASDDTSAIQKVLDDSLYVTFGDPSKSYLISNTLTLRSNHYLDLRGCTITQTVANKPIFQATSKDNVWILAHGAVLYGEGTWSNSWASNTSRWDHGITFLGCTRSGIVAPVIKNMAHCGICIKGGTGIKIIAPHIEGTHAYSTALSSGDNFQNGIYITDHATYGIGDDIIIIAPDISGVAQGILRENQGSAAGVVDASLAIVSPNIHDIPGQHAFYIQGGKTAVSNPVLSDIALSGFKVQSADSNQDIQGFSCTGLVASDIASNMFEIASVGTGSVNNLVLSGVGDSITGYGLAITGEVKHLKADLVVSNVGIAIYLTGANAADIDIAVNAQRVIETGVLITATDATGIKIRPTLRECNSTNGTFYGIHIASASAEVDLIDPDVTDANNYQVHGIFNATTGATIKVRGSARFTGASNTAVRCDGAIISEWPSELVLSGATGDYYGDASRAAIRSSQPIIMSKRSTTNSNVILWGYTLEDESAYIFNADIVGKLAGSAQRGAFTSMCLAYRDGGNATIQGSPPELSNLHSASFAGVYSWGISVNGVYLLVNSGGTANYDWSAKVSVVKVIN